MGRWISCTPPVGVQRRFVIAWNGVQTSYTVVIISSTLLFWVPTHTQLTACVLCGDVLLDSGETILLNTTCVAYNFIFWHDRSLLLSEGLAVQAKPDANSPWRGPGQLSGGQVALVGLALNLATQAVRPAPLYLMDEVRDKGGVTCFDQTPVAVSRHRRTRLTAVQRRMVQQE